MLDCNMMEVVPVEEASKCKTEKLSLSNTIQAASSVFLNWTDLLVQKVCGSGTPTCFIDSSHIEKDSSKQPGVVYRSYRCTISTAYSSWTIRKRYREFQALNSKVGVCGEHMPPCHIFGSHNSCLSLG
jgi:hypothetical protein